VDPPAPGPGQYTEQVRAEQVPGLMERICGVADEHPGELFEITWRIVER
jgi:hypothetical protein